LRIADCGLRIANCGLRIAVEHACAAAPDECCGVLLGRGDEVLDAVPARNIADDPQRRFLIDPEDHFRARREGRARGLDVVGFYHSHPRSAAEPSARDAAECSYPGSLHLIVGLLAEPAEVGLFRAIDGNFQRVPFVTVG
jgi:proteasome lid subunit RPN8/RPN11